MAVLSNETEQRTIPDCRGHLRAIRGALLTTGGVSLSASGVGLPTRQGCSVCFVFSRIRIEVTRPENLEAFMLSKDEVERMLDSLALRTELCAVYFRWRPNLPDEADNMVVECAVAGACDFLVTLNTRDFAGAELASFGFEIVAPSGLLHRIR